MSMSSVHTCINGYQILSFDKTYYLTKLLNLLIIVLKYSYADNFYTYLKLNYKEVYIHKSIYSQNYMELSLVDMTKGSHGVICRIDGGKNLTVRLEPLGVSIGKRIEKISSMVMRGPVIVKIGNSKVAIGIGMASKIIVNIDPELKNG